MSGMQVQSSLSILLPRPTVGTQPPFGDGQFPFSTMRMAASAEVCASLPTPLTSSIHAKTPLETPGSVIEAANKSPSLAIQKYAQPVHDLAQEAMRIARETSAKETSAGNAVLSSTTLPPFREADEESSTISLNNSSQLQRQSSGRLNKFVRRLYEMLKAEQGSGIVEWRRGLLVLHSTRIFAKKILPKYFSTRNFKTFRRQLNYYGFVHVRSFSTTGDSTTALWVNQELAQSGYSNALDDEDVSLVLQMRRVEPNESAKTVEARRVRKRVALSTVEHDLGVDAKSLQVNQIRTMALKGSAVYDEETFRPLCVDSIKSPSTATPSLPRTVSLALACPTHEANITDNQPLGSTMNSRESSNEQVVREGRDFSRQSVTCPGTSPRCLAIEEPCQTRPSEGIPADAAAVSDSECSASSAPSENADAASLLLLLKSRP